jgi:hypothetical protein
MTIHQAPPGEDKSALRIAREAAGYTLARAAFWLQVSTEHLGRCERGEAGLTAMQQAELAGFYSAAIAERLKSVVNLLGQDQGAAGDEGERSS